MGVPVAGIEQVTDISRKALPVGILFSLHGPYNKISNELFKGAMLAVNQINQTDEYSFRLEPIVRDPGGNLDAYREACVELLRRQGVTHVVGCYTSSSRKEVIPVVEKYDGLLWYPSHYEGYESSPNVIYTGASPNQYLVPLISHMMAEYGNRIYCVGSNYIWSWENNRTVRQLGTPIGGEILAERYVNIGSTDVSRLVQDILEARPSFVFNSLIGSSSYEFNRCFDSAMSGSDLPRIPVCSATISEPELCATGVKQAAEIITSRVYFQSIPCVSNEYFVKEYKSRYGEESVTSEDAESAYIAVMLLAASLERAGNEEIDDVKSALHELSLNAPQGLVKIDPSNNHCYLTPCIGRSNDKGQFEILWSAGSPMKPDPYMLSSDIASFRSTYNKDVLLGESGGTETPDSDER